jgi:hypothetical protein
MIEVLELIHSPKENKRFRITLEVDGNIKSWDFGAKNGSTFVDHADERKRAAYWARHCANPVERHRIENVIPSAALFSAYLLWGNSPDIFTNLVDLNTLFQQK